MTTFITWLLTIPATIERWLISNYAAIRDCARRLGRAATRIGNVVVRAMIIGVILLVIEGFNPEIAERMPNMHAFYTGMLEFGDFAFAKAMQCIYSILTGNFSEFWRDYTVEARELFARAGEWLSNI